MQNKMKGEDTEITKERAESKRYYDVFKSFFINRTLFDEAYKIYEDINDYITDLDITEANFNDINKQFTEQVEQYDKIKNPLEQVFRVLIPDILVRIHNVKLKDVVDDSELILRNIVMAGLPSESTISPLFKNVQDIILQSYNIQNAINIEISTIRDKLFELNPQGGDLSKN